MSSPWDDVPDVYLDGRSMVAYPDPAPESTAAMWAQWREQQAQRKAAERQAADADDTNDVYKNQEPPIITLEAEEFDEPIPTLGGFVKLAVQNGWELHELAHARCTAKGKIVGSGERAGERHPSYDIETQWCKISKPGVGRAVISYTLRNGKPYAAQTHRSFNGQRRSDKEMREILKA